MRHNLFSALFIILVLSFSGYSVGVFDRAFGSGGVVTTDLGSDASVRSVKQQSDGKIIVLGRNGGFVILLRYNADGSLDATFGTGGKIVTSFSATDDKVSFAIQSNGLFAVGNNVSVVRYTSTGSVAETVNFPFGDFAGFGENGKIATASLIDATFECGIQPKKIRFNVYQPDGTLFSSTQFCSGSPGSGGVISIWGVVGSSRDTFFVGYTSRALNVQSGRVNEVGVVGQDRDVDVAANSHELVDLAATRNTGYVSLGYVLLSRQLPSNQYYEPSAAFSEPKFNKVHGYDKIAAVRQNSLLLVLNAGMALAGYANISNFPNGVGGVLVQNDNKIVIAGQAAGGGGYNNIRLTRYSTVYNGAAKRADFEGDGKSDISVWRGSTGTWYINKSSNNSVDIFPFGLSNDKIVPADYDGDGITDIAVWRPSTGTWYRLNSSDGSVSILSFGLADDLPVPNDYDGDDKTDIGIYRPSTGVWWISQSSNGALLIRQWGTSEDKPTIGDFDGDAKADFAVWRPSNGVWYRMNSSNGAVFEYQFGLAGDKPTAADYDGDGKTDVSVFRPSNGVWYRVNSRDNSFTVISFGASGDLPVPMDYDDDGKADLGFFRPSNGTWNLQRSTLGLLVRQFGIAEDLPAPNAFIY